MIPAWTLVELLSRFGIAAEAHLGINPVKTPVHTSILHRGYSQI
jgi:hypothetical protein